MAAVIAKSKRSRRSPKQAAGRYKLQRLKWEGFRMWPETVVKRDVTGFHLASALL